MLISGDLILKITSISLPKHKSGQWSQSWKSAHSVCLRNHTYLSFLPGSRQNWRHHRPKTHNMVRRTYICCGRHIPDMCMGHASHDHWPCRLRYRSRSPLVLPLELLTPGQLYQFINLRSHHRIIVESWHASSLQGI
jgi:hypothetical protein